ncbi:hypothetical protein CEB3_c24140 [Peptococcaceae bacterium CEB3]|nr:hypothetical protein CEB3_c24140 [Peptococcaceae bacterium CEB3]
MAVDVETTGLDPNQDEIIEFAAWRVREDASPEVLHFFARPARPVPERVLRLTGISREELETADSLSAHREEILAFLGNSVLVGHNLSFDINMLEHGLKVHLDNPVWDTLDLSRIFFPSLKYYRLASIAEKLHLDTKGRLHRAQEDAWVAAQVLEACWQKGLEYDLSLFRQASVWLEGWTGRGFFASLERTVRHRFPDRPIRTDWRPEQARDSLFPGTKPQGKIPEAADWVGRFLSASGSLAQGLPGYESRPGQVVMGEKVTKSLVRSEHVVIEAGTGTGKSLAYLTPSLWWAKKTGHKVIIATHTIPLQEQLARKDVPILETTLPFSFRSQVLKGKNNYFCLRNWLILSQNPGELSPEERIAGLSILTWLRETETGDAQELPQSPGFRRLWPRINAETCNYARCPHSGTCFFLTAKQRAEDADLLIINHSLLFSDIKTGGNVLPEYHYAVVDEAHHLYSSALEHLGTEISLEKVSRMLDGIHRPGGPCLYAGIKANSSRYSVLAHGVWERFALRLEDVPGQCASVREQARGLFQLLAGVLGENQSLRLVPSHKSEDWWGVLKVQAENLSGRLGDLGQTFAALQDLTEREEASELETLRAELGENFRLIESLLADLSTCMDVEESGRVIWLEKSFAPVWKSTPVDVSAILREKLFDRLDAAILTSATLSIAGSFAHFLTELGLATATATLTVDSPFDYDRQMQFYIVKGLMDSKRYEGFLPEDVAEFTAEIARRMGGRTLVLFTSHQFLRATNRALRERLERVGIETLGQGIDGARSAILEEFRRNPQSVLLGANSFWEGIDITGEALSCVILVKLPFCPPGRPLMEARAEFLARQGKNAFRDLFLPEAIIRFKQGFGRLIRSGDDRGAVVLLDSRITEKSYGRLFLSSLPVATHVRGDRQQIIRRLEAWLGGGDFPNAPKDGTLKAVRLWDTHRGL